jgi:hypothetical protein
MQHGTSVLQLVRAGRRASESYMGKTKNELAIWIYRQKNTTAINRWNIKMIEKCEGEFGS